MGVYIRVDVQWWQPWANTLAYLPLNWNANDYSGNGNNWTVYNANWVTENNRQYIQGTNSTNNSWAYVVLPIIPITSECTFSAWVKFNTSNTQYCNIVWCYYHTDDSKCLSSFTLDSSTWWVNCSNGSWLYNIVGQTSISIWWHLVTVTIKAWEQKWFLDGVVKWTTGNATNFAATNTVPFTINRLYNSTVTWWCAVWDFILEDKVRTAQEVVDYYDLTKSLYGIS